MNPFAKFSFHRNFQELTHVKLNGDEICLKYHCIGRCDNLCPRAATHTNLGSELNNTRNFVKKAKMNYKAHVARQTNQNETENETNQETPPTDDQGETNTGPP